MPQTTQERPAEAGMDRERLARELERQRAYCEGRSPLYAAVLRGLAVDAEVHPSWLDAAVEAWRGRPFAVGWEAAHLLLACLHFWALKGQAPELASVYPSCGGSGGDPGEAARAFLRRAPWEFWERLAAGKVQTNEVDRSVGWMLGSAAAFPPGLPFHLVEIGASAGLNLIGDRLPHRLRFSSPGGGPAPAPAGWEGPRPVLSRAGLDLRPRRLSQAEDRLWLKACVWADDLARLDRLDRAVDAFRRLEGEPGGPVLERCAFADAPAWIEERLKPRAGEGVLVFNSIATIYLDDGDYARLSRGLARALGRWEGRGVWVELERARGAAAGPLELAVRRPRDGGFDSAVLASAAPRPEEITVLAGWDAARVREGS